MHPGGDDHRGYLGAMPVASDARLLVLLGLRLGGFVEPVTVTARYGLAAGVVDEVLAAAGGDGLARHREGRVSGWSLTGEGRSELEGLLAAELDAAGARPIVAGVYERFGPLNKELLATCTAWQVRDEGTGALNDHSDAAYDAEVIARLGEVDGAVQTICAELAASLERFAGYGPRLAGARERVERGEPEWFTKPMIDSYHTVWFELHEDLLATLGIERASEGSD
jgi:hypothetical protein